MREELSNRSIADGEKGKLEGSENLKNPENHAILYIESEREISSLTNKETDWVTTYREKRRTL